MNAEVIAGPHQFGMISQSLAFGVSPDSPKIRIPCYVASQWTAGKDAESFDSEDLREKSPSQRIEKWGEQKVRREAYRLQAAPEGERNRLPSNLEVVL